MIANYGKLLFVALSVLLVAYAQTSSAADAKPGAYGTLLMIQFTDGLPGPSVVAGLDKIDELTKNSDQKGLLEYANSLEARYGLCSDKTDEYILLSRIAGALMLQRVYNSNQRRTKQTPTGLAVYLLKQEDVPLDVAAKLAVAVLTFFIQEAPIRGTVPVKERAEYSALALKALRRIDLAISPSFDPKEVFGNGGLIDINPREQPSAPSMPSVQEFRRMNYIPYHQTEIYDLRKMYRPQLVTCLGYLYAQSPRNVSALVRLMNKYHTASSLQTEVLSQVKADQNGAVFSAP